MAESETEARDEKRRRETNEHRSERVARDEERCAERSGAERRGERRGEVRRGEERRKKKRGKRSDERGAGAQVFSTWRVGCEAPAAEGVRTRQERHRAPQRASLGAAALRRRRQVCRTCQSKRMFSVCESGPIGGCTSAHNALTGSS